MCMNSVMRAIAASLPLVLGPAGGGARGHFVALGRFTARRAARSRSLRVASALPPSSAVGVRYAGGLGGPAGAHLSLARVARAGCLLATDQATWSARASPSSPDALGGRADWLLVRDEHR